MQARLFDQLGEWSMLPDAELAAKIAAIGAEPGGTDDLSKARRLFAKALETPGGLKIQTIHAFCQYLLSRFPLEAGVPASFNVLDDQHRARVDGEARTRVLERAGEGDAVRAAALAHLLTETSEARLRLVLDAALGTDRRKLDRYLRSLGGELDALRRCLRRAHGADETRDAEPDHGAILPRAARRRAAASRHGGLALRRQRRRTSSGGREAFARAREAIQTRSISMHLRDSS